MEKIKEKLEKALDCFTFAWDGTHDFEWQVEKAEVLIQEALALIEEMSKTGVWMEIPELNENGGCNHACPFWEGTDYGCFLNLAQHGITDWKPIFWCPRYKEEGK